MGGGARGIMPDYKVKAKVLIDIETYFSMAHDDPDPPTADTLKFCVDEDISRADHYGYDICGMVNDCEVVGFICEKVV